MKIGERKHHFTEILYFALRKSRKDFNPNDFKWELGAAVIYDIDVDYGHHIAEDYIFRPAEKPTLFGIPVEVNMENLHQLKLYEDITNKIAIPESEEEG